MTSVLGLNTYNENSSAALIIDGKLCGCVQEERFTRIKYDRSFPINSIKFLLKKNNIRHGSINSIIGSIRKDKNYSYFIQKGDKNNFCKIDGFHHLSHGASAYRFSPFNKANILVVDACGDNNDSITFFVGDNGSIHKIWTIGIKNISPGIIYKDASIRAGFQENNEGKFMGLSSYGIPYNNYKDFFFIERHNKINNNYAKLALKFNGKIDFFRMPSEKIIRFSATIQRCLEDSILNLINEIYSTTKIENFCFAGGIFLNSKLLGNMIKQPFVKEIFVQPNASDSGLSLGYAAEWMATNHGFRKFGFNVFSGPSYNNDEILKILKTNRANFKAINNPAQTASALIQKNKIIGWFQGAMEWGPRALGNRSILANPHYYKNIRRVNKIKGREFWRPLAPSFLKEEARHWLKDLKENPFMMMCFFVNEKKRKLIPAVTHVDGTARAQTVTFEFNPLYYSLIKDFYKLSGIPCVLNTSFNFQGEPIICSPQDALKSFEKMDLNHLIMGDYLISK